METFEVIKKYLNEENENILYENNAFIWVDWREFDEDIVKYVENKIHQGLTSKTITVNNTIGTDFFIIYKYQTVQVKFDEKDVSRDSTLITLNTLLMPEYEIRFCLDSLGNDTLAFVVLSQSEWTELEKLFGIEKIEYYFEKIMENSEMFRLDMDKIFNRLAKRK